VLDLLAVMVFVAIGRSVHDHGIRISGLTSTAWPFAVGLVLGWWVLASRQRPGTSIVDGLTVCVVTVVVAMVLRVIAGQGTAAAFIFVAFAFLGLFMLGWRALFVVRRRRSAQSARRRRWPQGS
jgi:hypothetical protein